MPGCGISDVSVALIKRNADIVSRYSAGETLQKIGDEYLITRERVRQILKKNGLTRKQGGQYIAAIKKRQIKQNKQDALYLLNHGLTRKNFVSIPVDARKAFRQQKQNARMRGIEWAMRLAEWWQVWQESGMWEQRGRGYGYCMARHGDTGSYHPDNVYICTCAQNSSDQYNWNTSESIGGRSRMKKYTFRGESMSVRDLARTAGISEQALRQRLYRGWGIQEAVTVPLIKNDRTS